jgi:hypothetical protein
MAQPDQQLRNRPSVHALWTRNGNLRVSYLTCGLGSAPHYKGSEKNPLNFYELPAGTPKLEVAGEIWGHHHGDRIDPSWWDRNLIILRTLISN